MSVWDELQSSRVTEGLAVQMASGTAPQAWLLLGPTGSGKRPAALAMAASLNCPEEPGIGCGVCWTCTRIARRRHPDVHHIVPEGPLIPVDLIREIVIPEAARSPFEASYKVFVIEEAERMNPAAQNALLKTLEEPQPDTMFVLISDREEDLLETIRSRCRTVRLEPLSEDSIVDALARSGASAEAGRLAARLSDGDLERAHALALDDSAAARRAVWMSIPPRLVSPVDALDAAVEIAETAGEAVKAHETAQKIEVRELADALGEGRGTAAARNALAKRHRRELRRLEETVLGEALQTIGGFYRDILAARAGDPSVVANADFATEIEVWAGSDVSEAALVEALERCATAGGALARNANQQLVVESTLVELARLVPPPLSAAARSH
jgi:DNA polymerase-3 subunit delta'